MKNYKLFLITLLIFYSNYSFSEETKVIEDQFIIAPLVESEILNTKAIELVKAATENESKTIEKASVGALIESEEQNVCSELVKEYREIRQSGKSPRRINCEQNLEYSVNLTPNDSYYAIMNNLHRLNMPTVWDKTVGSNQLVMAVVDSGIDYSHPDLASNMWINSGEIPNDGIDNDGNGYVDDIYGFDSFNNDGDPRDDNGHGTHCAGTIGAASNNSTGITGISWNIKLMAIKFLGANGSGSTWGAINGLAYIRKMKERGVNIVGSNNSWGGGGYSSLLLDEINKAKDLEMIFIAAAGNSTQNLDVTPSYPANYPATNIISVAAISSTDGSLASFSNFGATSVHIAAPGVSIPSTYLNNGYVYLNGTSMAAPHVSGAVALLKSYSSGLTMSQIKNAILNNTTFNSAISGKVSTNGELNILAALNSVPNNPLVPGTPTPTPTNTFTPTPRPTPTNTATPTVTPTPTITPTPMPGTLTMRIISDSGIGLAGVLIQIKNSSGTIITQNTSAADGSLVFTGLSGGTYTVTYSKAGYTFNPADSSITISGNISKLVTALQSTYSLSVKIIEKSDANILSSIPVNLFIEGVMSGSSNSSSTGIVSFNIPYGKSYRIEAEDDSYGGEEIEGTLTGNTTRIIALGR